MREELATLRRWQDAEECRIALASVVSTTASAPRGPGATLGLHPSGRVIGSVSGGCVEAAVVEVGTKVLKTGLPQLVSYGISDSEAFEVGLTCGGTIDVFVRPIARDNLDFALLDDLIRDEQPVTVATVIEHDRSPESVGCSVLVTSSRVDGSVRNDPLHRTVVAGAEEMLGLGTTRLQRYGPNGEQSMDDVSVFFESFAPRPRMIIFGANDFAAEVVTIGRFLGFHVTVCDARSLFASTERFPHADRIVHEWPHHYLAATHVDARTVLCVLTHDPKFDVPVLQVALRTEAAYIGVMGSRRTHRDRFERLRAAGVSEGELARLRSPIGLDLGGRSPQETAVSIAGEIVLERHGGSARPLTDTDGPIHRRVREGVRRGSSVLGQT